MISVNIVVPASFWEQNLKDAMVFSISDADIEKDSLEVGKKILKYEEQKEGFLKSMRIVSVALLRQLAREVKEGEDLRITLTAETQKP